METKSLDYIKELITYFQLFLDEKETDNEEWLSSFAGWLTAQQSNHDTEQPHPGEEMTELLIGMQLVNISNMLKKRLNQFVTESPFATFMDFQFLFILKEHSEMTKSELIHVNNMEMSSGIEVVKRLLKQNWIEEKANPQDKRSKLIRVNTAGEDVLLQYKDTALSIYRSYSERLNPMQKEEVLKSLSLFSRENR